MKSYRILIADDHSLLRHGIKSIIQEDRSFQVVAEAGDALQLLELLEQHAVDMVIIDVSMPHMSGIEAIHRIRRISPGVRILVLTMHADNQHVYQAFAAGAHGYMAKDEPEEELLSAIRSLLQGKTYISPQLSAEITEEMFTAFREQNGGLFIDISKREQQVLRLVAKGLTSRKIAEQLEVSIRTVDHHRAALLRKFKVKNTVDLVKQAVRFAMVDGNEKNS